MECETVGKAWKDGKNFYFLAFLMNELRRSSFEKASIRPAVGIYVILDFSICSNMYWTFSEMSYEGFW